MLYTVHANDLEWKGCLIKVCTSGMNIWKKATTEKGLLNVQATPFEISVSVPISLLLVCQLSETYAEYSAIANI